MTGQVVVVGGGPVGCVLAAMLARRGHAIEVYEKRSDMRRAEAEAGRSINLVLTRRGLRALERIGLRERVMELTVPVLGRMMHSVAGELTFQPYGKDDSERNYSVSRAELNRFLLNAAEQAGAKLHFETAFVDHDVESGEALFENQSTGETLCVQAPVVFGADGAPSAVRETLVARHGFDERVEMLEHGYKELSFPAAEGAGFAMAGHALHIWPRGQHMLMGLANLDGSFTGTIYLPKSGEDSFQSLSTRSAVRGFFETHYPDAIALLNDGFEDEFLDRRVGSLGTVRCSPWHLEGRVLLIGDAAHGIVPFFGQGLNSGFEDCVVLDDLLAANAQAERFGTVSDLSAVFARFDAQRKPNTDAIADMALENFVEMRDRVADDEFLLRKRIEARLERELGDVYRSRYALVMYSSNSYRAALEIGRAQEALLAELSRGVDSAETIDLRQARQAIVARLVPLYEAHGVDLSF